MERFFFYWIIYFESSQKGHLPNLVFLVSLRSKDVSSGSSESPGSGSEMVAMVPPGQLPIRLLSGVGSAISTGKNTLHVLILRSRQPAIWYHQCQEVTVVTLLSEWRHSYQMSSVDTQTHGRMQTQKIIFFIEYKDTTYIGIRDV